MSHHLQSTKSIKVDFINYVNTLVFLSSKSKNKLVHKISKIIIIYVKNNFLKTISQLYY